MKVSLRKLDGELPDPVAAHVGDAAVDLYAAVSVTIGPGERAVVPTGVAVAIPRGFAGLVLARSGLAARHGIGVVNGPGLVDSGYRGEIKAILINQGDDPFEITRGDRIAQLAVIPVAEAEFDIVEDLPGTERGIGGLGSSGR